MAELGVSRNIVARPTPVRLAEKMQDPDAAEHAGREAEPPERAQMKRLRSLAKVLPEHARNHNRTLALQTLYHAGPMTRADLARETGLTRVTISNLMTGLIDSGIVSEGGRPATGRPGKPGTLIDINRLGHQIIGVDLSDDALFEGAVTDLDGTVIHRDSIARPENDDGRASLAAMLQLVRQLIAAADRPVLGVGIATQGVVTADGVVRSSPNLGWEEMPLRARASAEFGLPVVVTNDANSAVLAEYTFGGGRSDFMLIRFGRGVGAGLISGGQPLAGVRFAAGEIGHVVVGTDDGPRCVCGRDGCLEAWLNVGRLTTEIAEHPDQRVKILRDAGARLAVGIAPIVAALDLPEIVLSGPADVLDENFIDAAAATLRARTLDGVFDDITFRLTDQPDIVLRGAAVTVLTDQLGIS